MHLRRNRRTARNGSQTFRLLSATVVPGAAIASRLYFFCRIPGHTACHRIGHLFRPESDVFFWRITGHRSEEHTSELQSLRHLVCRLLLEKKKKKYSKLMSNHM